MGQAGVDRWFFVRTASAGGVPQIVFRFHGPATALNETLLPALHDWSGRLRAAGLLRDFSLTSYWPEAWRYGGTRCMAAAEEFFCVDSRLCAQVLATAPGSTRPEQMAVPGVRRILSEFLISRTVADIPGPRLSGADKEIFNDLRPAVRAAGEGGWPPDAARRRDAEGQPVSGGDWCEVLASYRDLVEAQGRDLMPIASSLVHMHCNRLAGPGRSVERVTVALARDLMLARSTP